MEEPIDPRPWKKEVTDDPLRLAIVGVGQFARDYILPAVEISDYCQTTVLVSDEYDTIEYEEISKRLSSESFLNGVAVEAYDAVYVATPNHLHERMVRAAISMEKPVLCEKPLAGTVDSARSIYEQVEDADLPFMIGYRVQFKPVIRALQTAIRDGLIGTPIHAHSGVSFRIPVEDNNKWRLDAKRGGGALRDIGIYPINTLKFLLERPLRPTWADLRTVDGFGDVDIHAAFSLSDGNNFRGVCTASFASEPSSSLRINGSEGLVVVDEPYHPSAQPDITIVKNGSEQKITPDTYNEYAAQLDYFAQCVFYDDHPTPDINEGVSDIEIIELIEKLAYQTST